MYIYSVEDPANPAFISVFWHVSSCDPVVVQDNIAYVTLRAGNICGGTVSQLILINISDVYNPKLIRKYNLEEPYGLGVDGDLLFICDGNAGLKIYDKSNIYALEENQIMVYKNINAYDVIPAGGMLIMTGNNGLYQYDYSDPENITLLSHINTGW